MYNCSGVVTLRLLAIMQAGNLGSIPLILHRCLQ
jgi:hypothetical protein